MKRIIVILALLPLLSCADWVVKAFGGNPAVVSVTAGVIDKVSDSPASWTPTWAIKMNKTNAAQYTDSGLYVQRGWDVRMLVNVRSNVTGYTGVNLTGAAFRFGIAAGTGWRIYWGPSGAIGSTVPAPGWYFLRATGELTGTLFTNGSAAVSYVGATFATNTTVKFLIGYSASSTSVKWDVARVQFIDQSGTVQRDLIATSSGTFTNISDGATFTFGAGGTGGTSGDSTNVTGQTFPTMNWAPGGGQQ